MFRNAITETPFTGTLPDSVFSRINGKNFRGDVSLIATLRAMVFPRMSQDEGITVLYSESTYTKGDIAGASHRNVIHALIGFSKSDFPLSCIGIYNCCSYSSEDNDAVLNIVEANFQQYAEGFVKIEKVTEFFRKSFRVICFINPELKTTMLFCGGMDVRKFHFLQVAIPVMLPWYFDPDAGVTEQEMALLQSLRGKDHTKYLDALNVMAQKYDFRTLKIKNLLGDFETRFLRREIDDVTNSVDNRMGEVARYEDRISNLMRECYDLNIRLMGLNAKLAEGSSESDITDYFICNKNLSIVAVDNSRMVFECKGYLEYYDEEIIKKYLGNKNSVVYKPDGRDRTSVFSHDEIKMLMTALFIDQRIKMKFCAGFEFDLRGSVRALGRRRFGSDFNDATPNTHIDQFSCLGNNERLINKRLAESDYIGAIEQCISSCKSLNFADAPVISEFMRRIYGISNHDVNMRCIELPDGSVVTPTDAVKWLKEQDEQKKKEQEAAKAAEAKEEAHE